MIITPLTSFSTNIYYTLTMGQVLFYNAYKLFKKPRQNLRLTSKLLVLKLFFFK